MSKNMKKVITKILLSSLLIFTFIIPCFAVDVTFPSQPTDMLPANVISDTNVNKTFPLLSSPDTNEAFTILSLKQGTSIRMLSYTISNNRIYIHVEYLDTTSRKYYRGYMPQENINFAGFDLGQMPYNDPLTVRATGTITNSTYVYFIPNPLTNSRTDFMLPVGANVEILYQEKGVMNNEELLLIKYQRPGTTSYYGYGLVLAENVGNIIIK